MFKEDVNFSSDHETCVTSDLSSSFEAHIDLTVSKYPAEGTAGRMRNLEILAGTIYVSLVPTLAPENMKWKCR